MLKNLYFLRNYNDYFNREIRYEPNIQKYKEVVGNNYTLIPNYNFNINDNVNTSITVAAGDPTDEYSAYIWRHGTYLVAQDMDDPTYLMRWFVTESVWIRQGQYRLTLRRDLVSDFLKPVLNSTVYVIKGYIRNDTTSIDSYNPLAFNLENFSANQIKTKEISIKDKSQCKWVVGYLNKEAYNQTSTISAYNNIALTPDITATSLSETVLHGFVDETTLAPIPKAYVKSLAARIDIKYYANATPEYWTHIVGQSSVNRLKISKSDYQGYVACAGYPSLPVSLSSTAYGIIGEGDNYQNIIDSFTETNENATTQEKWEQALDTDGKVLHLGTKYYRIKIDRQIVSTAVYSVDPNADAANYQRLKRYVRTGANPCEDFQDSKLNFRLAVETSERIRVSLVEVSNYGYSMEINPSTMARTQSESFDIFAIPLLEDYYRFKIDKTGENASKDFISGDYLSALVIGQELTDIDTSALDLQILPYAPIPDDWINEYTVKSTDTDIPSSYVGETIIEFCPPLDTDEINYAPIYNEDGKMINMLFYISTAQFSKVINYNDTNDYSSIEKVKCINQLDTWRLESGDYSSAFEFNMARNGGVKQFEIDCAYKPYHPYIHVAPLFGGLYGSDFNDTRGLVCSNTDYSLPRLTDAWESYERNNINYLNSWKRTLLNMDVQRGYQRAADIVGAFTGTVSGAASGAVLGTAAGHPIAGAIAGGVTSAAAGVTDIIINEGLYKENKKYAQDQFDYNIQNIQALPDTMTAAGALNPNNKVFPQLSYYTCRQLERDIFLETLKWDGMSIGALTNNLADYVSPDKKSYVKARIVYMPLEDVSIDSHELAELATELAKGILIDKGVIN